MKIDFTFDEMVVLAIFEEDCRSKSIESMYEVLGEVHEDPEMEDLLVSTLEKLEKISDEEYLQIDFREYDSYMEELDDFQTGEEVAIPENVFHVDFSLPGGMILEAYEGI